MIFFTEDMKTNIPLIDSQHRSLVDFANKAVFLCAANPSKEEMKQQLDFLANYVVKHFGDEERFQLESNYPRYRQHKEVHQEFVHTFLSISRNFEKNGSSEELNKALTKSVSNWIITHIRMEDVRFGEHYAQFERERANGKTQEQADAPG